MSRKASTLGWVLVVVGVGLLGVTILKNINWPKSFVAFIAKASYPQTKSVPSDLSSPVYYHLENSGEFNYFYNDKLKYHIKLPKSWQVRDENGSGELFMVWGGVSTIELQSYYTFNLSKGQTIEEYLDSAPSPAKSQPTKRVALGNNAGYLQRGIPSSGELGEATYLKLANSTNSKYLAIVVIKGTLEDAFSVLDTLEFY